MVKLRKILIFVAVPLIVFAAAYLITQATSGPFCSTGGNCSAINTNNGVNVGIGTTSPASTLVVVGSNASSASSSLNITNSTGSSLLFVRNDGNIGIDNSSPNYNLDITGNSNVSGSVTANNLYGNLSASYVSSGIFGSNVGGGNYSFPAGLLINTTSSINGAELPYYPLQISGGAIFAGTSSPQDSIVLVPADPNGGFIAFTDSRSPSVSKATNEISGNISGLYFWNGTSTSLNNVFGIDPNGNAYITNSLGVGMTSNTAATFQVENASSSNALVVAANGNVGIGTTTPTAQFSVAGNTIINGNLQISGSNSGIIFPDGTIQKTEQIHQQIITSSGTFSWPSNVNEIFVTVCGGGGGGGGGTYSGGAGGGGSNCVLNYPVIGNSNFSVTIGSGGSGGSANNGIGSNGGNGATSSFGFIVVPGGNGGSGDSSGGGGGSGATIAYGNGGGSGSGSYLSSNGGNGANGYGSQILAGSGTADIGGYYTPGAGGSGYGAGGGGGSGSGTSGYNYTYGLGGHGAQGVVVIQWYQL